MNASQKQVCRQLQQLQAQRNFDTALKLSLDTIQSEHDEAVLYFLYLNVIDIHIRTRRYQLAQRNIDVMEKLRHPNAQMQLQFLGYKTILAHNEHRDISVQVEQFKRCYDRIYKQLQKVMDTDKLLEELLKNGQLEQKAQRLVTNLLDRGGEVFVLAAQQNGDQCELERLEKTFAITKNELQRVICQQARIVAAFQTQKAAEYLNNIQLLEKLTDSHEILFNMHWNAAVLLIGNGNVQEAAQLIETTSSRFAQPLTVLQAAVMFLQHRYGQLTALQCSGDKVVNSAQAGALMNSGDYSSAAAQFTKVDDQQGLAVSLALAGEEAKCLKVLDPILSECEKHQFTTEGSADVLNVAGVCLFNLGRLQHAENLVRRSLEKQYNSVVAGNLGKILLQQRKYPEACQWLARARAEAVDNQHLIKLSKYLVQCYTGQYEEKKRVTHKEAAVLICKQQIEINQDQDGWFASHKLKIQ